MKLKVNWLEHILGSEWEVTPAGGATGDAYFARFQDRKLFLKRNSSPFLAVLSAEGIVPKLVWTKRMENGDVITAQHWLDGRELKPQDMNSDSVTELLSKIHHSKELLDMLKRLGKESLLPQDVLLDIRANVDVDLQKELIVEQGIMYLEREVDFVQPEEYVVCHCDVNHNNWLLGENEQLYLIDWDGAMIADPAIDLGLLLYWYIDPAEWKSWLEKYGITLTDNLQKRMKWYVVSQSILFVQWHRTKQEVPEMNYWLNYLKVLLENEQLSQ
ncbi:phosphotransferase family protein [Priestia flexa]|uniref:phosphotransferase family protein n=1 Tax=Priestia TaxID=2800373 RepID=UPI0015CAB5AB|nr:phosphotransferase family protein [Priestia flexa]USY57232.1 phosphotransferase family protein [Bacillus sp. 1780r2a1]